ncbi:MAG TPA: helix-turn-helix domain-containing protein [Solirubrobacterales bacterium]|jgi:DNA-binding PadR family transcriptional regulator|nr:helix-turn-helix domain-containing protein [Solirubrobacterales bacterium]
MTLTAPKRPSRREIPRPTGVLALANAYAHPMRVRILSAMSGTNRRCSPTELGEEWGLDTRNVSYHFRELCDYGLLEIVEEKKKRGAIEHIYATTRRAVAWAEAWEKIPPVFRQHLAALTLRLGVEAVGASIDAGEFEARDDVVLAQDTMLLDEAAAAEALAILADTVDRLVNLGDAARARLEETGEDGILISYLMAGFAGSIERPA